MYEINSRGNNEWREFFTTLYVGRTNPSMADAYESILLADTAHNEKETDSQPTFRTEALILVHFYR